METGRFIACLHIAFNVFAVLEYFLNCLFLVRYHTLRFAYRAHTGDLLTVDKAIFLHHPENAGTRHR